MLLNPNFISEPEDSQVDLSPVVSAIENLGKKIDKIELPEPKEPLEEVSITNLDEVKLHLRTELSKALKPILSRLEAIKFPEPKEFPSEIKVSNLEPQIAPLDSVRVNNLDDLKESILGLYNAILGIQISVPQASINIPAPVVNVAPNNVEIDVSGILNALEPLKYLSDRPTKPISVRMSDGQKFVRAITELKKSTDQLGVVYAGSSGISQDEMRVVSQESSGLSIPKFDSMTRTLTSPTEETYTYSRGGSTVSTVVITYTDSSLSTLLTVAKT